MQPAFFVCAKVRMKVASAGLFNYLMPKTPLSMPSELHLKISHIQNFMWLIFI